MQVLAFRINLADHGVVHGLTGEVGTVRAEIVRAESVLVLDNGLEQIHEIRIVHLTDAISIQSVRTNPAEVRAQPNGDGTGGVVHFIAFVGALGRAVGPLRGSRAAGGAREGLEISFSVSDGGGELTRRKCNCMRGFPARQ